MWFSTAPEPKQKALRSAPPGPLPCDPTLILGLPSWVPENLGDVLRNDLVWSKNSTWTGVPQDAKLKILENLDGESLLRMTQTFGGTVIVGDDELYSTEGNLLEHKLELLARSRFQAIITDDSSMINDPGLATFVASQYQQGVSVVIWAIEGIFNLAPLNQRFGVDWQLVAYTKRDCMLNDLGRTIISDQAFPFHHKYAKSHFLVGSGELFTAYVNPADYEDDESEDSEGNAVPRRIPDPEAGSAVMCFVEQPFKSVSYFGFVGLDVSWGAIALRLCYAGLHAAGVQGPGVDSNGVDGVGVEASSGQEVATVEAEALPNQDVSSAASDPHSDILLGETEPNETVVVETEQVTGDSPDDVGTERSLARDQAAADVMEADSATVERADAADSAKTDETVLPLPPSPMADVSLKSHGIKMAVYAHIIVLGVAIVLGLVMAIFAPSKLPWRAEP